MTMTSIYDKEACTTNYPDAYAAGKRDRALSDEHGYREWNPHLYDLLSGEKKAYMYGWSDGAIK